MSSKNGGMLRRSKKTMLAAATAAFGVVTLSSAKRTDSRRVMGPPSRQGSITNTGAGGALSSQPLPPSPSDNIASNLSLGPSVISPTAPKMCNFSCLDTSGWNQVCGTDGVTYTSPCDLDETVCEQRKALRPDVTRIRHNGPCLDDGEDDVIHQDVDDGEDDVIHTGVDEKNDTTLFSSPLSCEFSCLDANEGGLGFTSLCGTDGNTYPSVCMLERGACRAKKEGKPEIFIDYTGPCEEDEFEHGEMLSSHGNDGSSPAAPLQLRSGATLSPSSDHEIKYYV